MKQIFRTTIVLGLFGIMLASSANSAIQRTPRRYNMISFYGGYATPHGTYTEFGDIAIARLEADSFLNESFYLGFDYGVLYRSHLLYSLGFRMTEHDITTSFRNRLQGIGSEDLSFRTYDLDLNINYMFTDISRTILSPYVGIGFQTGITTLSVKGFSDQNDLKAAVSANFGADFRLTSPNKARGFFTISSANSYTLAASDNRPKYLHLGLALRYFFRP